MINVRVIARLDIKGPNLVKGIHLEGLRVLGKPEDFAKYYYEHGADELLYMDVVASLYGRNSLTDIVERTAREIFIPLTVGGGLRSLADIREVLRCGADKVSLNTAALANPQLIREAALSFGSSTVVVAIEAIKSQDGKYLAYTDNGREHTGREVVAWAEEAASLGAGEIVITAVDREGTATGFDLDLVKRVASAVKVPVIAHGGAGSPQDVVSVVRDGYADAVAVASILHYGSQAAINLDAVHHGEGNREFLRSGRQMKTLVPATIESIKHELALAGFDCRKAEAAVGRALAQST